MTHIRRRRPTQPHRITIRLSRKTKADIAALALTNGVSFETQVMALVNAELAR